MHLLFHFKNVQAQTVGNLIKRQYREGFFNLNACITHMGVQ